jgi:hypothetical protein
MNAYGGWSDCPACKESKEVDDMSIRTRTVKSDAKHGGKPCGALTEEKACYYDYCKKDCPYD